MRDSYDACMAGVIILTLTVHSLYAPTRQVDFDISQNLYPAYYFVANGTIPVHGPTNGQIVYNPPFTPWLYIPPMLINLDFTWAMIAIPLLLHTLAILLLYDMGRRYFNPGFGVAAATLYAFSTKGIFIVRTLPQLLLPPFFILVLFCLFKWLLEDKPLYLTPLIVSAAVTSGIHWGGAIVLPMLAVIGLLYRDRLKPRPIIAGMAVALILWSPYLWFEHSRGFKDVWTIVVSPPVSTSLNASDITNLCPPPNSIYIERYGFMRDSRDVIRPTLMSMHPAVYKTLSYFYSLAGGLIRTLYENFHWDYERKLPGSLKQQILFYAETMIFLTGLGILLYRQAIKKNASETETLLLVSFLLPAALLNIHTSAMSRPDLTAIMYGPQILIVAYACVMPRRMQGKTARIILWSGLMLLIILAVNDARIAVSQPAWGVLNPQKQMVAWIAEDLARQGRVNASIRYDLLRDDTGTKCWIVSFGNDVHEAYIGVEHDYPLESTYGIKNTRKTLDGWAPDPDYTVLMSKGMSRYNLTQKGYEVRRFGDYVVLKTIR